MQNIRSHIHLNIRSYPDKTSGRPNAQQPLSARSGHSMSTTQGTEG